MASQQRHHPTAALAFFIILPLPSVLLITVILYSQFYGPTQGTQQLIAQIQVIAGPTIASLVSQLLEGVTNTFTSIFNSFLSIVFAVAGAIGAFAVLQDTFNMVWEVHLPKGRSLKTRLRERLSPFILVLVSTVIVVGWLEYTSLLFDSISQNLRQLTGTPAASMFFFLIQVLFSFASAVLLFAIIFKEIPDTAIEWGDVWIGAVITAIAFTVLNNVFGFYLRNFPVTSVSGAAGSLIILLLWIFVIAEALMYGAQFSKCYTETLGSHSDLEANHPHPMKPNMLARELKKLEAQINPKEKPQPQLEEKEETSAVKGKNEETQLEAPKPEETEKRKQKNNSNSRLS